MSRPVKYLLLAGFACSLILVGCKSTPEFDFHIVQIDGASWAGNVTTSYAFFGSTSESEEMLELYMPASDGDLLYITVEGDRELYYRYHSEEGNYLEVEVDTLTPWLVKVNGRVAQISLSDETDFGLLQQELRDPGDDTGVWEQYISSLLIRDSIGAEMIGQLGALDEYLHRTGLFIEANLAAGELEELIALCEPDWMAIESFPKDPGTGRPVIPENLDLLWLSAGPSTIKGVSQRLENLVTLIAVDWEPGEEPVDLSRLKSLNTLTLAECDISNLNHVVLPGTLEQLNLVACDTLLDITSISRLPHLKSLGLTGSNQIGSLAPVQGLSGLKALSFPGHASQKDFAALTGQLPLLEKVELLDCPGITNVGPLMEHEMLRFLVLDTDSILPANLESLHQLEMVVLSQDLFDHSPELISELRAKLPDTLVVPGSGLCMGSGWLLLLIPMFIAARLFFRKQ